MAFLKIAPLSFMLALPVLASSERFPMPLPETEVYDAKNAHLETGSLATLIDVLTDDHACAIGAVKAATSDIEKAVEEAQKRLEGGEGRLIYLGAGTSGRLGVLDGVELTPTFGWSEHQVDFLMAGGEKALTRAVEGAEDDREMALADLEAIDPGEKDVMIGLSASGGAPYVVAAIEAGRKRGCLTIGVANSCDAPLLMAAQCPIYLCTGPETLQGSTRLKAGTSQKVFLSTFSTALMIKLGYVYEGLMINLKATNKKLVARRLRIACTLTGLDTHAASALLERAEGDNRLVVLMHKAKLSLEDAKVLLEKAHGDLHKALRQIYPTS